MRLLALDVERFGPVGGASLTLGPGLNVLAGPNDLGKSHLAEALRAVLLLPHGSTEHKAYVPWGSDDTPTVELTFQVEGDARWRVRKTFGAGAKGSSVLARAGAGGDFHTEATGREVDGRLRALLQWGAAAPGGRGGQKGLPETYLSTVLLGRQAQVLSIFQRTLEQDPDESGKKRLTLALQALAQPALFRKVLQEAQARVDQAFDSRGNPRRARGAPFVGVREEVKAAEQQLAFLQQQVEGSAAVRQQLHDLLARRDEQALRLADARARRDEARAAASRAAALRAAEERLEQARRGLQQVQAAHDDVAAKAAQLAALRASAQAADADAARAEGQVEAAARAARAAEERLRAVAAERADAALLQQQRLETRRVQLEAAVQEATRRAEAARAAGGLVEQAEVAGRELARAEADVQRLRAALARAEAEQRLGGARREALEAGALARAVAEAEAQRAARQQALTAAAAALADAAAGLERAEAEHQAARDQLQRVQSEAGAQQRALKEEELGRRTLQAEADQRAAEALAQRARDVQARAARVGQLQRDVAAQEAAAERARAAAAAAEADQAAAQAKLELLALLSAYLDWRAAVARRDEAKGVAKNAAALRAQALELRARADQAAADQAALALPGAEHLAQLRALERELRLAEAKVNVGLTVTIVPRREFDLQAASDGEPPESCVADPADEALVCEARRHLHLLLGDLAELTVIGGQEHDHLLARDLRARWSREVAPLLLDVEVADLDGLEARCRAAAQRRLELDAWRQQAAHLDAQAAAPGDAAARLQQAQRAADDREAALGDHERAPLEREATRLGLLGPAGPLFSAPAPGSPGAALEASRKAAEAALADARRQVEARRIEHGQTTVRVETQRADLQQARADLAAAQAALAALSGPAAASPDAASPEHALAGAEAALTRARADLAAIAAERAGLTGAQGAALTHTQERLRAAEAARDAARRARDAAQQARDRAQADVASLEGQLAVRRQSAAAVDLPGLEARVATLEAELAGLPSATPSAAGPLDAVRTSAPTTPAELERLRAAVDATREALSAAHSDAAARRANRDTALAARDAGLRDLGDEWRAVAAAAQADLSRDAAALAEATRELARLDQQRDEGIEAARAELAAAAAAHEQAQAGAQAQARAREQARSALDTAQGQLELLRGQVASLDRSAAAAQVAACESACAALPRADAALAHDAAALQAADAAVSDAEHLLTQLNQELTRAQGQLEVIGGSVIQERAQDAREALERVRARELEVELDYAAWKLLKETLEEAERQETTHLGKALVDPVSERFARLTAGRYGPLSLGPDLEAHGITALGELRDIERLSAGTRDQLSTLLRLTVAAQLQSALVLDDQLAHSDPRRLRWFTDVLREAGHTTQIVVFTCRPEDYLLPGEAPPPSSPSPLLDSVGGLVRAIDLERVVTRLGVG